MNEEESYVTRRSNFAAIPNAMMRDGSISIEARGLLALMMGMGDRWIFRASNLMKTAGCGKDKYQRMIRELKESGYLEVVGKQGEDGKFLGYDYIIHDAPTGSRETRQPVNTPGGKPGHLRRPISKNTKKEEDPQTPKGVDADDVKETPVSILATVASQRVAEEFVAFRREDKKRPVSVRAAKAMVKKLEGHRDPDSVLMNSIANDWQGIFPEKTPVGSKGAYQPRAGYTSAGAFGNIRQHN